MVVVEWQYLLEDSELPFLFQLLQFLFECGKRKEAHVCVGEQEQMENFKAVVKGSTNIENILKCPRDCAITINMHLFVSYPTANKTNTRNKSTPPLFPSPNRNTYMQDPCLRNVRTVLTVTKLE